MKTVNVLGTQYEIMFRGKGEDARLDASGDGYCDTSIKVCVVDKMDDADPMNKSNLHEYRKSVIRHELVHAFLYESGIDGCADWMSEEMVDWIAIQFPKMERVFREADAL